MISKLNLGAALGAVAFIATLAAAGFTSPSFAANYSEGANGGGSAGYNHQAATDYRLKHHSTKHHPRSSTTPQ